MHLFMRHDAFMCASRLIPVCAMTHAFVCHDSFLFAPCTQHRAAAHCNTLHHTAPYCTILHHTAPHCTTPHHTTPHCNTLQHTATHFSTHQHTAKFVLDCKGAHISSCVCLGRMCRPLNLYLQRAEGKCVRPSKFPHTFTNTHTYMRACACQMQMWACTS